MMKSQNSPTHRRMWAPKKKIETSKKLLVFAVAMVVLTAIVTVVAVFVLQDTSPLGYLITGVFGLASTAYGFYYWKAKNENISKYGRNIEDDPEM